MILYAVLDNEKKGREARKGSDEALTLVMTVRGKPAYKLLLTPDRLQVREEQTQAMLLDVRHGQGKTKTSECIHDWRESFPTEPGRQVFCTKCPAIDVRY